MLTSHPTGGAWVGSVRTLADYILQPYKYTKSDVRESPLIWVIFSRNTTFGPPAGALIGPELTLPAVTYEMGERSFQVHDAFLWNSPPPSLRHISSYSTFKRAVQQYLLDRDS